VTELAGAGRQVEAIEVQPDNGTSVSTPIVHISSGRPGKTLAVVAGLHGTEYASVAALGRLIQDLEPDRVNGRLTLVPIANRLAFETQTMYFCPPDGKNLNRWFPGKPDGTYAEVLAYQLWERVGSQAQHLIDVHGGEVVEGLFPFTAAYSVPGQPALNATSRQIAEAFNPPYLVLNDVPPDTVRTQQRLAITATLSGIPAALVEAGQRGELDEQSIRFIYDGILNSMRRLGMLEEPVIESVRRPDIVREFSVLATATGLFHATVAPGDLVHRGQSLGVLIDELGRQVQHFTCDWDGVVLGVIGPAMVSGRNALVIGELLADA
jgi:predicted deacylase